MRLAGRPGKQRPTPHRNGTQAHNSPACVVLGTAGQGLPTTDKPDWAWLPTSTLTVGAPRLDSKQVTVPESSPTTTLHCAHLSDHRGREGQHMAVTERRREGVRLRGATRSRARVIVRGVQNATASQQKPPTPLPAPHCMRTVASKRARTFFLDPEGRRSTEFLAVMAATCSRVEFVSVNSMAGRTRQPKKKVGKGGVGKKIQPSLRVFLVPGHFVSSARLLRP